MTSPLMILSMQLPQGVTVLDVQMVLQAHNTGWYRFEPTGWVIVSSERSEVWWPRFQHLVYPAGRMFLARVDPSDAHGWMDQTFWTWFHDQAVMAGARAIPAIRRTYG